MSKETLHLIQGYVAKAARRLRNAQPNEILPLLRTGITRTLQDVRSGQTRHMIPLLQDYFFHYLPEQEAPRISNFCRNTSGWENETYTFTLTWGGAQQRTSEELILCIYPGDLAHRRANTEYQALSRLRKAGYPVPNVKHYGAAGERFSCNQPFLIIKRVDGYRMWQPLSNATGAEREKLLSDFCALLAELHALDWRIMADDRTAHLAGDSCTLINRFLADQQAEIDRIMLPGFEGGWEWILTQGQKIASPGPSIAHFDFHPNNIILRDRADTAGRRAVVIDWTNASITDYRFDLAWTLLLLCLYTKGDLHSAILNEYERHAGRKVENIEFFEAVACYARLLRVCTVKTQGAETVGLRAGAGKAILSQAPVIRRVYNRYRELTGFTLPEVESFLNTARV